MDWRKVLLELKNALTARSKEGLKDGSAFVGKNSRRNFDAVIEPRAFENGKAGTNRAAFGIVGPIDEPCDARLYESAGAHRARFDGDKQCCACEAIIV